MRGSLPLPPLQHTPPTLTYNPPPPPVVTNPHTLKTCTRPSHHIIVCIRVLDSGIYTTKPHPKLRPPLAFIRPHPKPHPSPCLQTVQTPTRKRATISSNRRSTRMQWLPTVRPSSKSVMTQPPTPYSTVTELLSNITLVGVACWWVWLDGGCGVPYDQVPL